LPAFGAGAHAETPIGAGSRRSKTPEKSRKAGKKSKKRVAPEPSIISEEPSSATDDELARGLSELQLDAPSTITLLPLASPVLPSPTWSAPATPGGGARAGLLALEDSDPPQFNTSTATFDQLMDISSRESSRPPSPDKASKSFKSKSKKASKKHHKEKSHKHSKDAHGSDKEGIPEEAVAPARSLEEPVAPTAAVLVQDTALTVDIASASVDPDDPSGTIRFAPPSRFARQHPSMLLQQPTPSKVLQELLAADAAKETGRKCFILCFTLCYMMPIISPVYYPDVVG
jgi:hypothetical protein